MTDTQHTPGPWRIVSDDPYGMQICDGDGVSVVVISDGATTKADLHLFASAPTLKAERDALQAFVKRIAEGEEHEPIDCVWVNLVKQARALLERIGGDGS